MGYDNRFVKYAVSHFAWFWHFVQRIAWLDRFLNRIFINLLVNTGTPRPRPFSLWGPPMVGPVPGPVSDYTTWTGLVNRVYTGRHLPPADLPYPTVLAALPPLDALFRRVGPIQPCPKSSALFGFFAQWFTDSFLRTDPNDTRRNTSNHEIDLCQIYGLNEKDTALIRSGRRGELRSQRIKGQEFPPFLFDRAGRKVNPAFMKLSYINPDTGDFYPGVLPTAPTNFNTPERKKDFFVTGLERGNSTIFYSAINTIFLREHNRLCRALAARNPRWDDHRLFETARNINIVQLLQIIVSDYINHLSPAIFKMSVEVGFAEKQDWYRTNRISAEFNLLYRWHQLIPDTLSFNGNALPDPEFRFNNDFLLNQGMEPVFAIATAQRAGRITLKNSAPFLVPADLAAVDKSRYWRMRPYNEYRVKFGLPPAKSFEDLTGEKVVAQELEKIYKKIDDVEFMVGLLAEARTDKEMLGNLMTLMVGVDAFSQALTNPLLSRNVYREDCFTKFGVDSIDTTRSFNDVYKRNMPGNARGASFAILPAPGSYGLPILGTLFDTLDFFLISGWETFFLRRQRKYKSTVFKINLFQPTIAMLDERAISALFASGDLVPDRPSSGFQFQLPPLELLGGVAPGMFEAGPAHDRPKSLHMEIVKQRANTLVTEFDRTMKEFTDRWQGLKQFSFRDELETFAVTFAFRWIIGATPKAEGVRNLFNNIFSHWSVAVTRYFPWSAYSRAKRSYQGLVDFVKGAPRFQEIQGYASQVGITDPDQVAKQVTYLLGNNSFLGIQSLLKSVIGELSLHPQWHAALRQEIIAAFGTSPQGVNLDQLNRLPKLDHFLREVLRLHPPVFFIFGRATRDRFIQSASGTFAIAANALVMGVIPFAQRDPAVFDKPDLFDPDRYNRSDASQHLIWPRGPQDGPVTPDGRTCPGKDVATLIAKLFCVAMLPRMQWKLEETPTWGKRLFVLNVGAPQGPMRVMHFVQQP